MAMLETSVAKQLEALAGYQEGSVVSRTLIGKKAGTVTMFAFDAGQALSEHTAPYDALVYVVDGKTEIAIAGEKHLLDAGQVIILPANVPHALTALTPFKMMLVMIKA